MTTQDRFRGCLAGLAAGDAVGTTVEFMPRGSFEPLRDMLGGGPFNLRPGQWTDDTSMALCLAESLTEKGGFNAREDDWRNCTRVLSRRRIDSFIRQGLGSRSPAGES